MSNLRRSNILLVVFDSLSSIEDSVSSTAVATPTLDRLRDTGAYFPKTYTPCPESSPARASLFSGLDPCVHGLWTNGVKLPESVITFPEILSQTGYASWLVGRWHLAGVSNWTTEYIRPGTFSHVDWAHGPAHRSRQNAYLLWLQQHAKDDYFNLFPTQPDPDNDIISAEQHKIISDLHNELSFNYWVGERIGALLSSHQPEQPFLAVAGFVVGNNNGDHSTLTNDGESANLRALQQADFALGSILDSLSANGHLADTTVIVTAAHGSTKAVSDVMHEPAIRVPLIISHADVKHTLIHQPVSTIDIAPTILDIAGIPARSTIQGSSLLSILDGSGSTRGWSMSRIRSSRIHGRERLWQSALVAGDMKLIVIHGNPKTAIPTKYRLFNLATDPDERYDLADKTAHLPELENMVDLMIDARCALEDRTEPRIAKF